MNLVACELRHLDQRIGQRGSGSLACIVSPTSGLIRDNDIIIVDTDHPEYPRPPAPQPVAVRRVAAPLPGRHAEARARWQWLHDAMSGPVELAERPAIEARIAKLAKGLGCSCAVHWRNVLQARPVDWNDPAAWAVAAHNDVNAALGKPRWPG